MQIPRSRSEKLKVRDESLIHITEEGLKRLREKLARLKADLPNLIGEAERTAAYGDRSDSAEYKEAKAKLCSAHRQILATQDQIKRSVVIKSGPSVSGKVRLGSVVVLETGGTQKTFQILGPHETDPAKGRISDKSPLGAALMNHAKGDVVAIKIGNKIQEYKILEIL